MMNQPFTREKFPATAAPRCRGPAGARSARARLRLLDEAMLFSTSPR